MRPHRKGGWSGCCFAAWSALWLPDPAVPPRGGRAELARALFCHQQLWENLKEKTTHGPRSKFLLRFRENKEQIKNKFIFLTSSWSTSPPNTQTCHDTKGQGGIAEEWLSQPKFRHSAAARAAGLESAAPERHCCCTAGTRHSTAEETDGTRAVTQGAAFTFSTRQYML